MAQSPTLQEERVPLASRIWISGADAATAILQSMVGASVLTYFYFNLLGLKAELISTAWLLFGIWNAINDPLFGYISDRTKTKLGRRIPYIRYGAPIFVLAFILFWLEIPGIGNSQAALFTQMLLALFIFDSLYTAIATSLYIMPYEVAISNKARGSILIWKVGFSVFTIVTPLLLNGIKPAVGDTAGINQFRVILSVVGISMGLIIFFSTFFYRERHVIAEQQFNLLKSFVECFKNRSFVVFEVLSFTVIFAQTALMQGLWYYFDEIAVNTIPLYAALAVGIIGGIILWVKQRERWGIKFSTRLFSLLFGIGCVTLAFLGRDLIPAALGFGLVGLGFAGGMYLIPLMNGDIMDYDEHVTGQRREGMYAGINSFITKPAISLGQAVLIMVMNAYGYDPALAKGAQSQQAETGILLGWAFVTGALLIISFLVLHYYPLAGKEWEKIKAALSAKHRQEEQNFLEAQGIKFSE
jgi:GPH family glycoside/pentoside/hexuronide:cation symporter